MENNILNSARMVNASIAIDSTKTLSSKLLKYFSKVVIAAAIFSVVIYFLKSSKKIVINNNEKGIIRLTKDDYNEFITYLSKSNNNHFKAIVEKHAKEDKNGIMFFAGEEAIKDCHKIMLASSYRNHPCAGLPIDSLVYISEDNKSFDYFSSLRFGLPKGFVIVPKRKMLECIKEKSEYYNGPDSLIDSFTKEEFASFKEQVDKDAKDYTSLCTDKVIDLTEFSYSIVGEFESKVYISYGKNSLKKYSDLKRCDLRTYDGE